MKRSEVFELLKARGIAFVEVEFHGGHDEGGTDGISLQDASREEIGTMQEYWDCGNWDAEKRQYVPPVPPTAEEQIDRDLSTALCKPVYDKYYGFAWEGSVEGKVIWDVAEGRVSMEGYEYSEHGESIDSDIEETDEAEAT